MFEVTYHDWVEFDYTNWKGKKSHRKIEVNELFYGSNNYHPQDQWLLQGYDLEKNSFRTFALKDMTNVKKIQRP